MSDSGREISHPLVTRKQFENLITRPLDHIVKLMLQFAQADRHNPMHAPLICFSDIPKEVPACVTAGTYDPEQLGCLYEGAGNLRKEPLADDQNAQAKLLAYIPFLPEMADNEHYVFAGGCIVSVCTYIETDRYGLRPHDADCYPIYEYCRSLSVDVQDLAMESYTKWLENFDAIMVNDDIAKPDHYLYRNKNCTTLNFTVENGSATSAYASTLDSFQMIHRAHPYVEGGLPSSVIAGFDHSCCKALLHRGKIYLTLDGALALYFGINPIDWRRESPSHLRRAQKYAERGFTIVYPGLPMTLGKTLVESDKSYYLPRALLYGRMLDSRGNAIYKTAANHYRTISAGKRTDEPVRFTVNLNFLRETDEPGDLHYIPEKIEREGAAADESDYGGDTTEYIALCYRGISFLIKEKYDLIGVMSTGLPSSIIHDYKHLDIEIVLEKTYAGHCSDFYYGDEQALNISRELAALSTRTGEYPHVKILKPAELTRFVELQTQLQEILQARKAFLQARLDECTGSLHQVQFRVSGPGDQYYTSSFKPVRRASPKDFWGPVYMALEDTIALQQKWAIMHARKSARRQAMAQKQPSTAIPKWTIADLPLDIVKMLFRHIDAAFVQKTLAAPVDWATLAVSKDKTLQQSAFESLIASFAVINNPK